MQQNRIEDILGEDEEILTRLRPNKRVFKIEAVLKGLPIALLWGGIDAFIIIMMLNSGAFSGEGSTMTILFLVVFFALHLIPVWAYIASVIKRLAGYKNVEYVFTDKRIILRSGLIGMDIKSFYYPSITAVNVKVGVLDRMFKVGDIYLESGQIKAVIDDIDNPYVYGSKIQEIINDMKSDMAFPNALRPEDNPGYNTKYTKK